MTTVREAHAAIEALEAESPSLHPAVVRSRSHFRETDTAAELAAVLDRIARRGSEGVILKALYHDNARLLRERRLSAVLHHDLRRACQAVMRVRGALPEGGSWSASVIQVVTPLDPPLQ